jgi:WD40 repeat protein
MTVRLWNLEKLEEMFQFLHTTQVGKVALSPDGRYAFLCQLGGQFPGRLWDLKQRTELRKFQNLPGNQGPAYVAFSPDGHRLLFSCILTPTHLFDMKGDKPLATFPNPPGSGVVSLVFSPDGRHGLAGSEDGKVRLWDLEKDGAQQQPKYFQGLSAQVTSVAYAPNNKMVAASCTNGEVIVWETSGKKHQKWNFPGAVHGVTFFPDSRHLAIANGNGTVYILRLDSPSAGK